MRQTKRKRTKRKRTEAIQNIKFKPKPRAAYFFPGDKNYIHGVTKVTSGTRYTAPFFWTITKLGLEDDK